MSILEKTDADRGHADTDRRTVFCGQFLRTFFADSFLRTAFCGQFLRTVFCGPFFCGQFPADSFLRTVFADSFDGQSWKRRAVYGEGGSEAFKSEVFLLTLGTTSITHIIRHTKHL